MYVCLGPSRIYTGASARNPEKVKYRDVVGAKHEVTLNASICKLICVGQDLSLSAAQYLDK